MLRAVRRCTARSSPVPIMAGPGPCTERIIAAGIRRVVAAMEDPFPQVNGRGFARLRENGIEVTVGVGREAAGSLESAVSDVGPATPAIRHPEGRGQHRRPHQRGAAGADADYLGGGDAARAVRPRVGGRRRHGIGDDPG